MSKKSNVIVTEILAACEIVMVPVKSLVKSAYNCRHIPLSSAEIEELAENIAAVGLLQNIVIHKVKGSKSKYGVAAGENRRLAFNVLVSQNRISPDYLVPAHVVDEAKALIVSYAENNNRKAMHPADQIVLFKTLRDQEKDASQIAASFGYTTRHVNRMLKLTDMAPALLQSLAENKINVDQLQALSICDSHERQVEIWEGAQHYMNGDTPLSLKRSASRDEVCIKDNKLVKFIGLTDYESAGGHIKRDLFSSDDDGFISDPSILERIAIEKLDQIASGIQESEGWSWALARIDQVYHYGTYGSDNEFRIMNDPDAVFSENQSNRISELNGKIEQLNEYLENFDSEEDKYKQFENAIIAMENEQVAIEAQAVISSWPDDEKHSAGIVVSLCPSGVVVQRGIRLINTKADTSMENSSENSGHNFNADSEESEEPKSYSAALVASLTSERTIAVQAELSKQPKVAMALLGYTLAYSLFALGQSDSPMGVRLERNYKLKDFAPTIEGSAAELELLNMKEEWLSKLPDGWKNDSMCLLSWELDEIINLISYCVSVTIDGVKNPQFSKAKSLVEVEAAMGFNILNYWKPTKENLYKRISKEQLACALTEAGMEDKVSNIKPMKKSDAAEYVANEMAESDWLPEQMKTTTKFK